MLTNLRAATVCGAFACAGFASIANADVLATMRYDSLSGSYNSTTQMFNAIAVDTPSLRTTGDVTRLAAPGGDAAFEPGFVSNLLNPADFQIALSAIPTANPDRRTGTGSFIATDRDGDQIRGDLRGTWIRQAVPGFIFFNGVLENVVSVSAGPNPVNSTFDGTSSGSFNLNLPAPQPWEGAIVQLVFGAPNFFLADFADRATGVTGQIVPTPGAVALLGLGGLIVAARRKR